MSTFVESQIAIEYFNTWMKHKKLIESNPLMMNLMRNIVTFTDAFYSSSYLGSGDNHIVFTLGRIQDTDIYGAMRALREDKNGNITGHTSEENIANELGRFEELFEELGENAKVKTLKFVGLGKWKNMDKGEDNYFILTQDISYGKLHRVEHINYSECVNVYERMNGDRFLGKFAVDPMSFPKNGYERIEKYMQEEAVINLGDIYLELDL